MICHSSSCFPNAFQMTVVDTLPCQMFIKDCVICGPGIDRKDSCAMINKKYNFNVSLNLCEITKIFNISAFFLFQGFWYRPKAFSLLQRFFCWLGCLRSTHSSWRGCCWDPLQVHLSLLQRDGRWLLTSSRIQVDLNSCI